MQEIFDIEHQLLVLKTESLKNASKILELEYIISKDKDFSKTLDLTNRKAKSVILTNKILRLEYRLLAITQSGLAIDDQFLEYIQEANKSDIDQPLPSNEVIDKLGEKHDCNGDSLDTPTVTKDKLDNELDCIQQCIQEYHRNNTENNVEDNSEKEYTNDDMSIDTMEDE